jgi:hypothetical protein
MAAGLAKEADGFGKLGATDVSKALRGIFFAQVRCKLPSASLVSTSSAALQTATKKNPYGKPVSKPSTIGIFGAGLMGSGIAQVDFVRKLFVTSKPHYYRIFRCPLRRVLTSSLKIRMLLLLLEARSRCQMPFRCDGFVGPNCFIVHIMSSCVYSGSREETEHITV